MSSNAWINVGVGILFAAVSIFTGGTATAALFAFSLGATASSLVLGPDTPEQQGMSPEEMQINQASEARTIPVVIGTTRLVGNYLRVDVDALEAKPRYAEQSGGKGGGGDAQQTGYNYTVPLAYGIAMGEIDELVRIQTSPGLEDMATFAGGSLTFTNGEPEIFEISHTREQGDQSFYEGGTGTFYPGSATQGTDAAITDSNHRHVCWVDFPAYGIDGSPNPRSMLFTIRRMPQVLDDAGNPISDFPVRAAATDADPEWNDANPAAVAWEIHRNEIWGKGMSVEQLDVASFREAAKYYERARIGVSTALGRTSITQLMGRLRDIYGLWIWWDGEKLRARSIYDRDTAYSPRTRIHPDDVIGDPQFSRPSLANTHNEIRLEFVNRENNWQKEVVTAQDMAHVQTIGGVRTQTVDGAEIGTRRSAELIAHAKLREMAYPAATAQLRMRRTYSGLQPGSFVEFLWNEWRETGMATTFWRVIDLEDDDQGQDGITVSLREDQYATPMDGELGDGDFTAPVPPIDSDVPLVNADLVFGDIAQHGPLGDIEPIHLYEPNSYQSAGRPRILIAPTREHAYVQSASVAWKRADQTGYAPLGVATAMPVNGNLNVAIPADGPLLGRAASDQFDLTLQIPGNAAAMEAATGLVQQDSDHFALLAAKLQALMLIGNEIFRIGWAEETAPGVMTIRTYMRGELGSERQAHEIGDPVVFYRAFADAALLDSTPMPIGPDLTLTVTPNGIHSHLDRDASTVEVTPIQVTGRSFAPFAPELLSATAAGTVWSISLRPRAFGAGAAVRADIENDAYEPVGELTGLSLRFEMPDGTSHTVPAQSFASPPNPAPPEISVDELTWIPDDGSVGTGKITTQVTFDLNPATLKIYAVRNGRASIAPLEIANPT